ncbi:MAG: YbaK/EbsC family protein [Acidimicrobiia bacterium]|nr:YbaK/EbsC family protein [Acidimicrobiia bacterium]
MDTPATLAAAQLGLDHEVVTYQRVRSIQEGAAAQGIAVADIVKTLVVRRGESDYVYVLVPGDREIDWPKLRAHLGVRRLSLPDAAEAKEATGYERGTITPFGASGDWPVIADQSVSEKPHIGMGGGRHGVSIHASGHDVVKVLDADLADVTRPGG